jgi:hypothetical protein
MTELSAAQREELEDLLLDLQHDLGKYIRLPLSFLPAEAATDEVRAALCTALVETRRSPRGVRSARAIWDAFAGEAREHLTSSPAYAALVQTVERALAWERALGGDDDIDRPRLERELGAVTPAIRAVIEELHGEA